MDTHWEADFPTGPQELSVTERSLCCFLESLRETKTYVWSLGSNRTNLAQMEAASVSVMHREWAVRAAGISSWRAVHL
jgi:hypothetical protein